MKTTPELIQAATAYWSTHKLHEGMKEAEYVHHMVKFAEQALKSKPAPKPKKEFVAPLLIEVAKFFNDNGYNGDAAFKFWNFYSSNNWKDSQNRQIVNWQMKARAVWFKPENKISDYNSNKSRMTY